LRRLLWLLALLVAVGAFAWLSSRSATEDNADNAAAGKTDKPGYVALDAELIETGPDGRPLYRLSAQRIERPADGSKVLLNQPQLIYQPDPNSKWMLEAEHGELATDQQRVEFTGAIKATGTSDAGGTTQIRTEHLNIDMLQQRGDTADRVYISWQRMQFNALGMHLNLRDRTLTLGSDGHGQLQN
jgi:LPS export ABC transporter protein LptC